MGVNRPKFTIGRILHYVETNAEHSPCIITRVWHDDRANVTVFQDQEMSKTLVNVELDEEDMLPGTVHWPERD